MERRTYWKQKKSSRLVVLLLCFAAVLLPCGVVQAEEFRYLNRNPAPNASQRPQTGDLMAGWTEEAVEALGLRFVDDTDEDIFYQWRYVHESTQLTPPDAYGQTAKSNGWGLDATIEYDFEGTYIGVIMQAGFKVANLCFYLDGELVESTLPYSETLEYAVVFAKDDLDPGRHYLEILLEEGNGFEHWYAEFDALLVEDEPQQPTSSDEPGTPSAPAPTPTTAGTDASPANPSASAPKAGPEQGGILWYGLGAGALLLFAAIAVFLILRKRKSKSS